MLSGVTISQNAEMNRLQDAGFMGVMPRGAGGMRVHRQTWFCLRSSSLALSLLLVG